MVKRCCYGVCKTDSRYSDRTENGVTFIPFPKPKTNMEKCKRWVRLCGRPHSQLNISILSNHSKAKHVYVCSKHFIDGKPTAENPDPVPASPYESVTPLRPAPKPRSFSEPTKRRRKIVLTENPSFKENLENQQPEDDFSPSNVLPTEDNFSSSSSALDLLAITAENRRLKEELLQQVLKNEELRRENAECKEKMSKLQKTTENGERYSVEKVRNSRIRNNFKYHTGFTYEQFLHIFDFLVPNQDTHPIKFKKKISSIKNIPLQDQLLLTLMKLRLNFEFQHLANLFSLSQQDASSLFRAWINYMFHRFASVPKWPERDVLLKYMPEKFKRDFPNTFVILDGTELKVERPSALRTQSQCYSDYKSATTLKGLVGIDPRGSFTFISMLFSGSISDKEITSQSGLLSLLEQLLECGKLRPGDGVMVDKGFIIADEINKLGLKLYIPPFVSGSCQMTPAEVALTKKIATHRVHVERAISRAKKFKIIDNRLELTLFSIVDQIWYCCCFLTGFMPLLIND